MPWPSVSESMDCRPARRSGDNRSILVPDTWLTLQVRVQQESIFMKKIVCTHSLEWYYKQKTYRSICYEGNGKRNFCGWNPRIGAPRAAGLEQCIPEFRCAQNADDHLPLLRRVPVPAPGVRRTIHNACSSRDKNLQPT